MIPSRDANDERMLEFDWRRGTPGQIHTKAVVSSVTFP